jgi:hypothetical protein
VSAITRAARAGVSWPGEEGKTRATPSRRGPWRLIAASPLPFLVPLWALWRDVYVLDAAGVQRVGGARAVVESALLTLLSAALVASFWAGDRVARVLGYVLHWLLLSVAFGVAAVLGVMHGFGGPSGNLAAPAWALIALATVAVLCVVALLATAALIVEDVREAGAEEG